MARPPAVPVSLSVAVRESKRKCGRTNSTTPVWRAVRSVRARLTEPCAVSGSSTRAIASSPSPSQPSSTQARLSFRIRIAGRVAASICSGARRCKRVDMPARAAARSTRSMPSRPAIRGNEAESEARVAAWPCRRQTSTRQSSNGSGWIRSSRRRTAAVTGSVGTGLREPGGTTSFMDSAQPFRRYRHSAGRIDPGGDRRRSI